MEVKVNRKLVFENGAEFLGVGFGANVVRVGELAFCTAASGYQEAVSDAANCGKMLCMTYPIIGSYGLTDEDYESNQPHIFGLIVHDYNDTPSNFRYTKTLSQKLSEHGIPGISGVDTRDILHMLREEGSLKAVICDANVPTQQALKLIKEMDAAADNIERVSTTSVWYSRTHNPVYNVAVLDLGIKLSVVRALNAMGCNVVVLPYNSTAQQILEHEPNGLFISSGPAAAQISTYGQNIKDLYGKLPILCTGLGAAVAAHAMGFQLIKKPLHINASAPVKRTASGKVITANFNLCYTIKMPASVVKDVEITHIEQLSGDIAGFSCGNHLLQAVTFNPEAAPGSEDAAYIFEEFISAMKCESRGE